MIDLREYASDEEIAAGRMILEALAQDNEAASYAFCRKALLAATQMLEEACLISSEAIGAFLSSE